MFFPDDQSRMTSNGIAITPSHPPTVQAGQYGESELSWYCTYDDDPFIVLTETKFSFRCIPVWIGTLLTGLGSKKKHM